MLDTKALAAAVAPVIREAVSAATGPLLRRIEDLEAREIPEAINGKDGASVTLDDVAPLIEAAVTKAFDALPAPADGRDGKDADPVEIERTVAEAIERAVAAIPAPINGKDGAPGKDGRDGVDAVDALQDQDGNLILTFADGRTKNVGRVVGRDGVDGKDGERGAQGFGLDDFDTDWRPEDKILVLSWDAGEASYSHELFIPYLRDAGVWKEGEAYLQGDCVSWGGSLWTAQEDTAEKPETGKAWRLAVKRGRDGKDFVGPQPKAIEKVRI